MTDFPGRSPSFFSQTRGAFRAAALPLFGALAFLAGCSDDPTGPVELRGEVAVVVNSIENSLTVVSTSDPGRAFTIGLGSANASAVGMAVRGSIVVVPLGRYPFAAVVDLDARAVVHTVALPEGSGATGVAFLNDSIALIANPNLNSVTPLNVLRGTTGDQIPVGVYPQSIMEHSGRAYVSNGNLDTSSGLLPPAGPGSLSVIDNTLTVISTIALSGENTGSSVVGGDGKLYVLNTGNWDEPSGSISVVNLQTLQEEDHFTGFGWGPDSMTLLPGGLFRISGYAFGILEWNYLTRRFTRGLDNPIADAAIRPVGSVGTDLSGRNWVTNSGNCAESGKLFRLSSSGSVEAEARVGICPAGLAFTVLGR
ncbi:MAG: hypothetical protein LBG44_07440 [Gemmatimonadota bacterium]|jgi:hypothetical protein|nr:hypothetical protein [Gemmatimonadota bacterium]